MIVGCVNYMLSFGFVVSRCREKEFLKGEKSDNQVQLIDVFT